MSCIRLAIPRPRFVALVCCIFLTILSGLIFRKELSDSFHLLQLQQDRNDTRLRTASSSTDGKNVKRVFATSHLQKDLNQTTTFEAGTDNEKQLFKRVLFYTKWFGYDVWPKSGMGTSSILTREDGKPCAHNCSISYDKNDLSYSDAVVFHNIDMLSVPAMKKISLNRNRKQRWVYHTHESPHLANDAAPYNGLFNWTMTYRRDSDVFSPYGYFREIQSPNEIPKKHFTTNYAKGKDKLIVWAVSHCGCIRDKIVQKMLQFLPVTVIGSCSKLFNQSSPSFCNKGSKKCPPFLKQFKFYLSFENGMCYDYITEKYWVTPFDHGMIPIVLGANYDAKVAIPGSFINVLDFSSIEALSNYIKYLDKNDTAYNEYFQWKTKYIITKPGERSWTCMLCANLYNNSLPRKVYTNLGVYWGVKSSCSSYEDKIQRLL